MVHSEKRRYVTWRILLRIFGSHWIFVIAEDVDLGGGKRFRAENRRAARQIGVCVACLIGGLKEEGVDCAQIIDLRVLSE